MTTKRADDSTAAQNAERWLLDHGDYLYRYAISRIGNVESAEDLVQETLLTAMQRCKQFRGDSTERTWLIGILRYKILEFFRRRTRGKIAAVTESSETAGEAWFDEEGHWNREAQDAGMNWNPNPRQVLEQKEFWDVLRRCLDKLPPKPAAVFAQRELEFLDASEIQKELNITESNLWVLLHRARNQLRRCIQNHWQDAPIERKTSKKEPPHSKHRHE